MANESFLIAGGGIAGLAAALGLARIGRPAIVLEQTPAFEEAGAGLQLGPNAVKALKYLGAWERVAPACFAPSRIVVRDGHDGEVLVDIPLDRSFERRFGEPYRVIHRADLLGGLLSAAQSSPGIALRPGKRLTGFTESGSDVVAETADGETLSEHALIGADGVRSLVRQKIIGDGAPRFAGQILFRALVPASTAPRGLDMTAVALWLCRGAHAVSYPVSAGERLNIVAAAAGSWIGESWSNPADKSEVMAHFQFCRPLLDALLAIPGNWVKWAGVSRAPARPWTGNRVVLVGDAAHPMLPYLAQGAAMALEDAAVLSAALAAGSDTTAAFAAYENQRFARVARVMKSSQRQALAYHATGMFRLARNALLRLSSPGVFLSRMSWLYGWEPPQN